MSSSTSTWYQLEFAVSRSLRYTAKRRAFFERCAQIVRVITAIAGAGTVATVFHGPEAEKAVLAFGALVGLAAAIDLVFEFSKRAMTYDHLYRCYSDLAVEIAKADRTDTNFKQLVVQRLQIEKDDPTSLSVLGVICSNEELEARGHPYKHRVGYWQGLFCQFGDFGKQNFKRIESAPEPPTSSPSVH